jgi:hypothetical protein
VQNARGDGDADESGSAWDRDDADLGQPVQPDRLRGSGGGRAARIGPGRPASLALGVGAADRVVNGSGGVAFPLELTLTPEPVFFLSAGAVFSGSGVDHAYAELGLWLLASLAVGGGYGAYDTPAGRKDGGTLHLFVGVPIPLDLNRLGKDKWLPYLEPYYRPSWGPWPGTVHEVGLMLKISYWFKDVIGKIGG